MQDDNPIVARLHRSGHLESLHRGAWVVVDIDGAVIDGAGRPDQLIFARSATKSLQALPLVESGAFDRFGFDDRHLALASASHDGDAEHVGVAADGLVRIGLDEHALRCGPQAPRNQGDDMTPRRIANNCSGKHTGFLAVARHVGDDPADYLSPRSVTQRRVASAVAAMTAAPVAPDDPPAMAPYVDGCSAPTFHLPLSGLALGLGRVANPDLLPPEAGGPDRADACRRITEAAARHPHLIAGHVGHISTELIRATNGRIFAKRGAEGVFALGIRGEGVGLAFKIDDGNGRGYEALSIEVLRRHGWLSADELDALSPFTSPVLTNWDGLDIGHRELELPS